MATFGSRCVSRPPLELCLSGHSHTHLALSKQTPPAHGSFFSLQEGRSGQGKLAALEAHCKPQPLQCAGLDHTQLFLLRLTLPAG
eukprot:1157611-Pelagomonas_calceolata.AAC.3